MTVENPDNPNPIGEKYSAIAREFLEQMNGRHIDEVLIRQLGEILTKTECEIVGVAESAQILGVSPQRVTQLQNRISVVGRVRATPLWLREDVERFGNERPRKPGRPNKTESCEF